jgi:hypothetical protein
MTEFVPEVINNNKLIFDIQSKPKNLKNFWAVVTKIKRHPFISHAVAIYINDKKPNGTIIYSNYFYHEYPDLYVIYDKDNNAIRVYTGILHRNKRYWEYFAFLFRNFFYFNLDIYTDIAKDRTDYAEKMYLRIVDSVSDRLSSGKDYYNPISNARTEFSEENIPRDPCFPYIWYNHRMAGKNEQ